MVSPAIGIQQKNAADANKDTLEYHEFVDRMKYYYCEKSFHWLTLNFHPLNSLKPYWALFLLFMTSIFSFDKNGFRLQQGSA